MDQETAFLAGAPGRVASSSRAAPRLNLTDRQGRLLVALARPGTGPEAERLALAVRVRRSRPRRPPRRPRPSRRPSPTPKPTASPTPSPPHRRRRRPSRAAPRPRSPRRPRSRRRRRRPRRPDLPADRELRPAPASGRRGGHDRLPGHWSRREQPADLACRYFDPEPITVPADPATLDTAVAGRRLRDALRGRRRGRDGSGVLDRGVQVGVQRRRRGGDLHRGDRHDGRGGDPRGAGAVRVPRQRRDGGDGRDLDHGRAGRPDPRCRRRRWSSLMTLESTFRRRAERRSLPPGPRTRRPRPGHGARPP